MCQVSAGAAVPRGQFNICMLVAAAVYGIVRRDDVPDSLYQVAQHQLRCLQLCRLLSGFPLFQSQAVNPEKTLLRKATISAPIPQKLFEPKPSPYWEGLRGMTDRPPGVATLPPGGFISCHHKFEANLPISSRPLDRSVITEVLVSRQAIALPR